MPTVISSATLVLGLFLLVHACYSAWEQSTVTATVRSTSSSSFPPPSTSAATAAGAASSPATPFPGASTETHLPLDISLEAIFSVFLICIGLVSGAEELKPISWSAWAGQVERESGGGGPYQGLEERMGFVDIRRKRREFAEWVKTADDGKKQ